MEGKYLYKDTRYVELKNLGREEGLNNEINERFSRLEKWKVRKIWILEKRKRIFLYFLESFKRLETTWKCLYFQGETINLFSNSFLLTRKLCISYLQYISFFFFF